MKPIDLQVEITCSDSQRLAAWLVALANAIAATESPVFMILGRIAGDQHASVDSLWKRAGSAVEVWSSEGRGLRLSGALFSSIPDVSLAFKEAWHTSGGAWFGGIVSGKAIEVMEDLRKLTPRAVLTKLHKGDVSFARNGVSLGWFATYDDEYCRLRLTEVGAKALLRAVESVCDA